MTTATKMPSGASLADEFAQFMRVKEMKEGYKHDSSGAGAATGYAHGPGGALSYPGVDADIFSTVVGDLPGVINEIPVVPSVYTDPTYEVLTGILAGSGSEPETPCANAPYGGLMKGGIVTAPFGLYQRSTREIELNRLGQRTDRADPVDLRLVNSPLGRGIFGAEFDSNAGTSDILTNEMSKLFFERAVEFHRLLMRQIWTGTPAHNNVGLGYKEFIGLNALINTNWRDAISGAALPSLYPDIKPFAFQRIDTNGPAIIDALTYIARYVTDLAERTGLMPVRWAWAMRPALFYELTKVWPCSYLTSICSLVNNGTNTYQVNAGDVVNMRDDMRNGRYLLIDGARWPVILDDGISELNNGTSASVTPGCFASDIFLLPFSVQGARSVLYFEHLDYTNPSLSTALSNPLLLARSVAGGRYLETIRQTNWCTVWQAKIEPRLIIRTPQLAGRLTNVQYCPLQNNRQPWPSDPYFINGGATTRSGPSYFQPF